jgi:hypothetical protein
MLGPPADAGAAMSKAMAEVAPRRACFMRNLRIWLTLGHEIVPGHGPYHAFFDSIATMTGVRRAAATSMFPKIGFRFGKIVLRQ